VAHDAPIHIDRVAHQHLKEKIAFTPGRMIPQFLHNGPDAKSVLVCLDEGQGIPLHAEDNQPFFYVIEGSGAILTDEGELAVSAGDLVDLARGSSRGMQARNGRMVVLAIAVL